MPTIAPELIRAFRDRNADFISIDGWDPKRLRNIAADAETAGLLISDTRVGDQYTAVIYRPTAKLRAMLREQK